MLEKIIELCKNSKYSDALKLIENELMSDFDLKDPKQEQKYKELLKFRVACNTFLGRDDSLILDLVRKDKYPSEINHLVEGKLKINLLYKGHFDFRCDAYVNTVDWKTPFENVLDNSATYEFVKRIGEKEIFKQIDKQKNKTKSDFLLLKHPELSAPVSYHILFYEEGEQYDLEVLEQGINKVLDDAVKSKISGLAFFPLGYALVSKADMSKRSHIAEELSNKIAETIISYYFKNRTKKLPVINFNFVTVLTMQTFDRAFYSWTKLSRSQFDSIKNLPIREKLFINEVVTKDPDYIKSLKDLFITVGENNPILLLGESGCGKSHLAKIIHKYGSRSSKQFISINCAMLKSGTIYPQLFGWKKGSFSDATDDGPGAIGTAEGGILFLDEIGYADLDVQRMLLKFLEDREYSRFGEQEIIRDADIRLILGTNLNLEEMIDEKTFQLDLYERIAHTVITIPPLRIRKCDIELLTEVFLSELNKISELNIAISSQSIKLLESFNWPGNIRQLKSYIEKLFNNCKYKRLQLISDELIQSDPPRNQLYNIANPFVKLESLLREILSKWNPDDGSIPKDLILPLLAKIYIDDSKLAKGLSSKYVGMESTKGEVSYLQRKYRQYIQVRDKFF